ncbi:hypothetical protein Btru_007031 [Bulinus truncatus]|nr:hypothetical protein Btru_007031 [Bulinus truncatus]
MTQSQSTFRVITTAGHCGQFDLSILGFVLWSEVETVSAPRTWSPAATFDRLMEVSNFIAFNVLTLGVASCSSCIDPVKVLVKAERSCFQNFPFRDDQSNDQLLGLCDTMYFLITRQGPRKSESLHHFIYEKLRVGLPSLTYTECTWVFALAAMGQGASMALGGLIEKRIGPKLTALLGGWCMSGFLRGKGLVNGVCRGRIWRRSIHFQSSPNGFYKSRQFEGRKKDVNGEKLVEAHATERMPEAASEYRDNGAENYAADSRRKIRRVVHLPWTT